MEQFDNPVWLRGDDSKELVCPYPPKFVPNDNTLLGQLERLKKEILTHKGNLVIHFNADDQDESV